MRKLRRPWTSSWLKRELQRLIAQSSRVCLCEDEEPDLVLRGPFPSHIMCAGCWVDFGEVPLADWEHLITRIRISQSYGEATTALRQNQINNPNWRVFMTESQPTDLIDLPVPLIAKLSASEISEVSEVEGIPNASAIQMIPGHVVFESGEDAVDGSNCNHRWILNDDNITARCLLCEGERTLTKDELRVIEEAAQAGVVFLKWPERFAAMARLQAPSKKARRRARKAKPGESRGVATGATVPEGFIPVKEAAAQLGTDPKRLRKRIRSGEFEATKVGGRVHVKIS